MQADGKAPCKQSYTGAQSASSAHDRSVPKVGATVALNSDVAVASRDFDSQLTARTRTPGHVWMIIDVRLQQEPGEAQDEDRVADRRVDIPKVFVINIVVNNRPNDTLIDDDIALERHAVHEVRLLTLLGNLEAEVVLPARLAEKVTAG